MPRVPVCLRLLSLRLGFCLCMVKSLCVRETAVGGRLRGNGSADVERQFRYEEPLDFLGVKMVKGHDR